MGGPKPLPLIDPPAWLGARLGPPAFLREEPAGDEGGRRPGYIEKKKEAAAAADARKLKRLKELLKLSATGAEVVRFLEAGKVTIDFVDGGRSYWDGYRIVIRSDFDDGRAALSLAHEANHARATLEGARPDPLAIGRGEFVRAMLREEAASVVQAIKVSQELGSRLETRPRLEAEYAKAGDEAVRTLLRENPRATSAELKAAADAAGFARVLKAIEDGEVVGGGTRLPYPEKYGKDWDDARAFARR